MPLTKNALLNRLYSYRCSANVSRSNPSFQQFRAAAPRSNPALSPRMADECGCYRAHMRELPWVGAGHVLLAYSGAKGTKSSKHRTLSKVEDKTRDRGHVTRLQGRCLSTNFCLCKRFAKAQPENLANQHAASDHIKKERKNA